MVVGGLGSRRRRLLFRHAAGFGFAVANRSDAGFAAGTLVRHHSRALLVVAAFREAFDVHHGNVRAL
jgi:hypothetical protein